MDQETEDLSDVIISLISSYRSCIKEYRFSERRILPEIASTYGVLLNDPQLKIPVSRRFLDKLGLSRSPIGRAMFEIRDYSGNRDRSENSYDDDGVESDTSFRGNRNNNRDKRRDYDDEQSERGNYNRRSFSRSNDRNNYSNRSNSRY